LALKPNSFCEPVKDVINFQRVLVSLGGPRRHILAAFPMALCGVKNLVFKR
jgi:hypothetical protein